MRHILCITPIDHIAGVRATLCKLGTLICMPNCSLDDIKNIPYDVDVIFTNPNEQRFVLDAESIPRSVKTIVTASTGTNHIDKGFCSNQGIEVRSLTRDFKTLELISSTAEHAFALMLSLIRNIPAAFDSVKRGEWGYTPFIGRQLTHMNAGVVGYGRLGRMFVKYCKAFGMPVYVYDPYVHVSGVDGITQVDSLGDLFALCGVVSLHAHLDNETRGMISSSVLSSSSTYLVNTARAGLVDEYAVVSALSTGHLIGYATDVLQSELGGKRSPLLDNLHLNVIITPHIGGMTREGQSIAYNRAASMCL
jgi:D-3-phosphoglycerate dehydrogenase